MQANSGFWGSLSAGGFCGFGDFVGSKSHLRRLSNGLVSVLPMEKFGCGGVYFSSKADFLFSSSMMQASSARR